MNDFTLEKKIGLTRGIIASWRNGKYKPGTDALIKIADYFNVSLDYLVGRSPPQSVDELGIQQEIIQDLSQLNQASQIFIHGEIKTMLKYQQQMEKTKGEQQA